MKLVTIVGARPQFIKAAAVSRVIAARTDLTECLVHTGQHYDANMSEVFFQELGIPAPACNLALGGQTHGAMTGRMLEGIEAVLMDAKPDWVLVYGDTNSTLAGALAAAKLHIPVAHVEAGLRSRNRAMPEEINRILTDHAATLLFAPTQAAMANLAQEGIPGERTHWVGDVMFDIARYVGDRAERQSRILDQLNLVPRQYLLATIHRAENTDDPARLTAIFGGLLALADAFPIVVPLHPRTRAALTRIGLLAQVEARLRVIPPVGFLDMVMLEKHARVITTDSGGVQKEAFFHGVPCLTLRNETEWVELVASGWNTLCPPTSPTAVQHACQAALVSVPPASPSPYGNGDSALRIVDHLVSRAGRSPVPV